MLLDGHIDDRGAPSQCKYTLSNFKILKREKVTNTPNVCLNNQTDAFSFINSHRNPLNFINDYYTLLL